MTHTHEKRPLWDTLDTLSYFLVAVSYLLLMGYPQQWWYRLRLWWLRRHPALNYDRLKLERHKYEAGFYQDDTGPAGQE